MEPFLKDSSKVKGLEILYFDYAEIEKFKGSSKSFAASGPLSILYFMDYSRFVLQINDWRYPLINRLPVLSQGKGSHSYVLPAQNGFFYKLVIPGQSQSHVNFESILENNSNFSVLGQEDKLRRLAESPDDKLTRHPLKETGPKEVITQGLKQVVEKTKVMTQTLKTGTMHLTSKRLKTDLNNIKNKDFRTEAHSTFKKDFFEKKTEKSLEFMNLRRENINRLMTEYRDLRTTRVPALYIDRNELEDRILSNKELAAHGSFNFGQLNHSQGEQHKKGFLDTVKQGINEIKDSISDIISAPSDTSVGRSQAGQGPMESHSRGRTRTDVQQHTEPKFEAMTHYQG